MLVSMSSVTSNTLLSLIGTVEKANAYASVAAPAWRQDGKMTVRITNTSGVIVYVELGGLAAVAGNCEALAAGTGVFQFETNDLAKVALKGASGTPSVVVTVW